MEKLPEAEALRVEYLDLMKTTYGTSFIGLRRAKAHIVSTQLGFLVTMSAFYGALFFLEGAAMITTIIVSVLLTLWWVGKTMKEWVKNKRVMCEYEVIEKKAASIQCKYFALTGTDIRDALTQPEIEQAFNKMLKEYKL